MLKWIIYFIIPVNLIFDIFTNTLFEKGGILAIIRGTIYTLLIVYILLRYAKTIDLTTKSMGIYFLYCIFLVPLSPEPIDSLRFTLKIFTAMFMFPVGYYAINTFPMFKALNYSLVLLMVIFLLNFVISQYFGIGQAVYTGGDEFLMGNLDDNWNIVAYALILIPLINLTANKIARRLTVFLGLVLFVLLIFGLKRSSIAVLIVGFVLYIYLSKRFLKYTGAIIIAAFAFIVAMFYFQDLFLERLEARGDKIQRTNDIEVLQEEARYTETLAVFEKTFSFDNFWDSFFGGTPFYSSGNYGREYGDRNLHVDFNLILNTTGIIGVIMYYAIFFVMFKEKKFYARRLPGLPFFKEISLFFTVIFICQFFSSLFGQIFFNTFRSIIFIYLGSTLGMMKKVYDIQKAEATKKLNFE